MAKQVNFGVIVFPGSNCDRDVAYVTRDLLQQPTRMVWHEENDLSDIDVVIVPGGFSYGDYLRCGAIARFSPAMQALQRHAEQGKLVLGICNGFQVLTEAGLLPGAVICISSAIGHHYELSAPICRGQWAIRRMK